METITLRNGRQVEGVFQGIAGGALHYGSRLNGTTTILGCNGRAVSYMVCVTAAAAGQPTCKSCRKAAGA